MAELTKKQRAEWVDYIEFIRQGTQCSLELAILAVNARLEALERVAEAARTLLDNIYEFDKVTDGEYLDALNTALAALDKPS